MIYKDTFQILIFDSQKSACSQPQMAENNHLRLIAILETVTALLSAGYFEYTCDEKGDYYLLRFNVDSTSVALVPPKPKPLDSAV